MPDPAAILRRTLEQKINEAQQAQRSCWAKGDADEALSHLGRIDAYEDVCRTLDRIDRILGPSAYTGWDEASSLLRECRGLLTGLAALPVAPRAEPSLAERTYQEQVMPMINEVERQLFAEPQPMRTPQQLIEEWREQTTDTPGDLYSDGRATAFARCADELELSLKVHGLTAGDTPQHGR